MRFRYRLAYYMVGFSIGLFFVAIVLSGKDARCNYFPNSRVLNNLRTKPFYYSAKASSQLQAKLIDTADVRLILTKGDVDFDNSNKEIKNGKLYIIEGKSVNKRNFRLKVINYPDKAVLDEIIRY